VATEVDVLVIFAVVPVEVVVPYSKESEKIPNESTAITADTINSAIRYLFFITSIIEQF